MKALVAGGGTGGHLTPALVIAEALAAEGWSVVLAGATRGIEARILPTRSFPFHLLPAEPLYRQAWWRNVRWPWLARRLIRDVDRVLKAEAPDIVVGTGGYAAGPVVWRAARHGIPTAIHESNALPGIATRMLARVVRHVYFGFPEAAARIRPGAATHVFVTGNPIRPPRPIDAAQARVRFGLPPDRPAVVITGGSQGARGLNRAVADALDAGRLGSTSLIWCTGEAHRAAHDRFTTPGRISVHGFLDPLDEAYAAADVAVCRAGALTTAEVAAWGLPVVHVPLPTAAGQHQLHNARAAEAAGGAIVIEEDALDGSSLAGTLEALLADPPRRQRMRAAQRSRARPDAVADVVSKIATLLT